MSEIRQYGGNTPPLGYVQFLVERVPEWYTGPTDRVHRIPFVLWVKAKATPYEDQSGGPNPCSHGWRVWRESLLAFGVRDRRIRAVCPCYGRIIE